MTFNVAGIEPNEGSQIGSCLSEEVLDRLTAKGKIDRRVIKP